MNLLLFLLCSFIVLGLLSDRLGGFTGVIMGILIATYVMYAFSHG